MPGFEPGSYGTKSGSSPIPTAHCGEYIQYYLSCRSYFDILIDNTLDSCLRRVVRDMGDEAVALLQKRVQIIK